MREMLHKEKDAIKRTTMLFRRRRGWLNRSKRIEEGEDDKWKQIRP